MSFLFCGITTTPITSCHLHSHDCWEMILQLSGSATSQIGENTYISRPGDILIIPPGVPHDGCSEEPYTDMYLQCDHLDISDVRKLHDQDGAILVLMNLLHKAFTENETHHGRVEEGLLNAIRTYLEKYIASGNSKLISDLKNEMYRNLSSPVFSVSQAVRNTGYHEDHVRRRFKEETGLTPLAYLTNMRLTYAQGLLLQENYVSIVDVAEKCGFGDSFYFSRLFKKQFGMSPLNYRLTYYSK